MLTMTSELCKKFSQVIDKDRMGKEKVAEVEIGETCLFQRLQYGGITRGKGDL